MADITSETEEIAGITEEWSEESFGNMKGGRGDIGKIVADPEYIYGK